MKRKLNLSNLFAGLLMAALLFGFAATAAPVLHVSPAELGTAAAVLYGSSLFMPGPQGLGNVWTSGISVEIWAKHIEENLFASNAFQLTMTDQSEYVNARTVHNPNAGAVPVITVNRAHGGPRVDPALRVDTTNDWDIDELTSAPFIITNAEEVELSYDKMSSVLYEQEMALRDTAAIKMLINVSPTGTGVLPDTTVNANILRSSGITNNDVADVRSSVAYTPGATDNRLNFTLYDIRQMKKLFDRQNIPQEDRTLVMTPDAADQILNDLIVTKFRQDALNVFDTKTGNLDTLLGFKVYIRSKSATYNNAATPVVKAYGAATAADDNDAILGWQKAFVARALGDTHVYETLNSATDYGDIYSALVRVGATKLRSSELGVAAIVQGIPA